MGLDHKMIKVSVIIPAYNVSGYIDRCIRSALDQTLKEIEIIVVNDGSKDDTLEKIRAYASDPRLVILNKPNGGLSSARNAGLVKARGEYLFHLDGDDFLEKDGLKFMYEEAVKTKADIVLCHALIDDDQGKITKMIGHNHLSGNHLRDLMLERIVPNVWTKLYKTELYQKNHIFHELGISLGEDLMANILLFICAQKVVTLEGAYLHYILRPTSITKTYNEKMYDVFKMIEKIKSYLEKYKLTDKYQEELIYLEFKHLFYYRIMIDVKNSPIHKDIYDRTILKMDSYLKNKYVIEFLNSLSSGERLAFNLYRYHYWSGRFKFFITRLKSSFLK